MAAEALFIRIDDMIMVLEFDEAKSARNREERGIGLERLSEMDLARAISTEDVRRDYGERRVTLLGPIEDLLHVAVVTFRVIECE